MNLVSEKMNYLNKQFINSNKSFDLFYKLKVLSILIFFATKVFFCVENYINLNLYCVF